MKRQASRLVSCSGKAALSAVQAKRLARHLREKGDKVAAYMCTYCKGAWHVGNTLGTKASRARPQREDDGGLDG